MPGRYAFWGALRHCHGSVCPERERYFTWIGRPFGLDPKEDGSYAKPTAARTDEILGPRKKAHKISMRSLVLSRANVPGDAASPQASILGQFFTIRAASTNRVSGFPPYLT
jgi:hypothetical protein